MPGDTKWIDGRRVPPFNISGHLFYVEAVVKNDGHDIAKSHVYVPLNASGHNIFVREIDRPSLKMAVLAEYFRDISSAQRVGEGRRAR